jgi:flavin-binding protein dodecin
MAYRYIHIVRILKIAIDNAIKNAIKQSGKIVKKYTFID